MKHQLIIFIAVFAVIIVISVLKNQKIEPGKIKYKEKHFVIDDSTIKSGDIWKIIEPAWVSISIYDDLEVYKNDLKQFSIPQKYIFAICWYRTEVNNGGHEQFYLNPTGIVWEDTLEGFKEIGLKEFEDVLSQSIRIMGGSPSKERTEREKQLDSISPGTPFNREKYIFEDIDNEYYKLEQTTNLDEKLLEYIKKNKSEFYFDGTVRVPE